MDKAMEELRGQCLGCEGCVLGKTRTKLVFGDGNPNAKVMLVGEGPGEQEDLQGIPFVGRAGFLLDDMMKMIDLDRSRVYIANIVKCRPPHNRDPLPEERDACSQWLKKQIEIVDPLIIICLGALLPPRSSTRISGSPGSTDSGLTSAADAAFRSTTLRRFCATFQSGRTPLPI